MACEWELLRMAKNSGKMEPPLNVPHNRRDMGLLGAYGCHNCGTPREYGWAEEGNPLLLGSPITGVVEQDLKS